MATTTPPTQPIPWPPNPPLQRVKRVHTVKPGESFATIARQEGIDVWMLIYFNFRTTVSAEVNWYLKNRLNCTEETADRKGYRFSGGEQIYIPRLPAPSSPPWPTPSSGWNATQLVAYGRWVQEDAEDYVNKKGYTRDCADFAIDVLVDFAKARRLPVALYAGSHRQLGRVWPEGWSNELLRPREMEFNVPEYHFRFSLPIDQPDYDRFASWARRWLLAEDLFDTSLGNTLRITHDQLRPGDLLVLPRQIATEHVQVVVSPVGSIMVGGKFRRVLFIVQGNTADRDFIGQSAGKPIVAKAWDLDDRTLYYVKIGDRWKEDPQAQEFLRQFEARRWNFQMFNSTYGLPRN